MRPFLEFHTRSGESHNATSSAVVLTTISSGSGGERSCCQIFQTADGMFQWRTDIHWPIIHTTFSPDSRTYVMHTTRYPSEHWWEEYIASTGAKIGEAYASNASLKTMQVNWAQSKGYQAVLGILNRDNEIFCRKERVCSIPDQVEWTEQAQVGDTHLVIMSPTHGVIIMKAPQDVHRRFWRSFY